MSKIVDLPTSAAKAWSNTEREIRLLARERELSAEVVEDALPRIKQHWEVIFEPLAIELPERPVPGDLSRAQAKAIQSIIDAAAGVVLDRLHFERDQVFGRFVVVELALSNALLSP